MRNPVLVSLKNGVRAPAVPKSCRLPKRFLWNAAAFIIAASGVFLVVGGSSLAYQNEAGNETSTEPELIVVERTVWECYSDRGDRDTCAGWREPYVVKWSDDVRVWLPYGAERAYVALFDTVLKELAKLLNLNVRYVDSKASANLEAYVGVPTTAMRGNALLRCAEDNATARGCADRRLDGATITGGSLAVWSDRIRGRSGMDMRSVITHELLHVLTGMGHSHYRFSIMFTDNSAQNQTLSDTDRALLRLHAHPLVKPGLSMDELAERIVYADAPSLFVSGDSSFRDTSSARVLLVFAILSAITALICVWWIHTVTTVLLRVIYLFQQENG